MASMRLPLCLLFEDWSCVVPTAAPPASLRLRGGPMRAELRVRTWPAAWRLAQLLRSNAVDCARLARTLAFFARCALGLRRQRTIDC